MEKKVFSKFDSGKVRVSLVDPLYLKGIAEVMTQGAEVHGADNWQLCEEPKRYLDALLRHTLAYWGGEKVDKDSGHSHLYHIGFNAMALDYFDRQENGKVGVNLEAVWIDIDKEGIEI